MPKDIFPLASAPFGAITLSLPQNINVGASPTLVGTNFTGIPNTGLTNSSVTINGTSIILGASGTVTAAAGTLTGTTLNSAVTNSSLTSLGTLTGLIVSGNIVRSVATGISAAGTTQGTSTILTKDINVVSTVSTNQGVSLPTEITGKEIIVINSSATTLNVYPNSGSGVIDSNSAGAAFSLTSGGKIMFLCVSSTQWYTLNATYN